MTNLDTAQQDYEGSMTIAAKYFERKPDDESWQRELAWPYAKLADVSQRRAQAAKDPASAAIRQASYATAEDDLENSLCLRREVAAREPAKTEFTRDVSYTLDRVGAVSDGLGDTAGAEAAYFESLAIRRGLAGSVADNALYLGDIALSLQLIGGHCKSLGDLKSALAFYDASAAMREKVVAISPNDQQAQQAVSAAHRTADDLQAQVAAQQPTPDLSGNWWQKVVSDDEAAQTKLRTAQPADTSACMTKVEASVEQIAPVTTGTVH
jgi:hypothetical protein